MLLEVVSIPKLSGNCLGQLLCGRGMFHFHSQHLSPSPEEQALANTALLIQGSGVVICEDSRPEWVLSQRHRAETEHCVQCLGSADLNLLLRAAGPCLGRR